MIRCHVPIFIQTSCVNERKHRRRRSRISDAYRYETFLPLAQLPDSLRALATTHTSVQNRGITIVIVNDIRHEKVLWACVQWRLSGIVLFIARKINARRLGGTTSHQVLLLGLLLAWSSYPTAPCRRTHPKEPLKPAAYQTHFRSLIYSPFWNCRRPSLLHHCGFTGT